MDAARVAEKEFGAEVVVIKKTSKEYSQEKDPPLCPSIAVNNRFIVKNDTAKYEALRTAILSDSDI